MDTLHIWLGLICDLALLSRQHSASLSIVDEFGFKIIIGLGWSSDFVILIITEHPYSFSNHLEQFQQSTFLLQMASFIFSCLILFVVKMSFPAMYAVPCTKRIFSAIRETL